MQLMKTIIAQKNKYFTFHYFLTGYPTIFIPFFSFLDTGDIWVHGLSMTTDH